MVVNSQQCAILDNICLVWAFPGVQQMCLCNVIEHADYKHWNVFKRSRYSELQNEIICDRSFEQHLLQTEIMFDRVLDKLLILHVNFLSKIKW